MKDELIKRLKERIKREIPPRSDLKILEEFEPDVYIDYVIVEIYLCTRGKRENTYGVIFSEIITQCGRAFAAATGVKLTSLKTAKIGGFLLYTFEEFDLVKIAKEKLKKNAVYVIETVDEQKLSNLWAKVKLPRIERLPAFEPFSEWSTTLSEDGRQLIKTVDADVKKITAKTHPIIFDMVNRAQKIGWLVNKDLLKISLSCYNEQESVFNDIWDNPDTQSMKSKDREARTLLDMALRIEDNTFYHSYFLDFRGRKYCSTAYLNEQGCDLARGLLLRSDSKPIGESGYFWLLVMLANNWGNECGREDGRKSDKIPIQSRADWAKENIFLFRLYATAPLQYKQWMNADKPWQFLAACIELNKAHKWSESKVSLMHKEKRELYSYPSHLEAFIDGSTNGSQHLAALTRDHEAAPYVNLVPQEYPGDLYSFVADNVWAIVDETVKSFDKKSINKAEQLISNIKYLNEVINTTDDKSEERREIYQALKIIREENSDVYDVAGWVFWSWIDDTKHKRKICKRGTMTIPYGATNYGLSQQIIDDASKHNIPQLAYMEHKWANIMGRLIYESCKLSMERSIKMLEVFTAAGAKADKHEEYLRWTVPITNFPVVQKYVEASSKKVWIQYGQPNGERLSTGYFENTYQIAILALEDAKYRKGRQQVGAAPNCIHSLDAGHLALIVYRSPFAVTTVHDSYGSLLADMADLFKISRTTFVEMYINNPLPRLIDEMRGELDGLEYGELDITDVLESEYCFS